MSLDVVPTDDLEKARADCDRLRTQIAQVIVGQGAVIEEVMTALVVGGHLLVEAAPGMGKTLLVRTLADALDVTFRRVQFTPDLMPADIIGTYVVMEAHGQRRFEFQQGPVFTNLLLADEINRATPKTQAALLEAMGEGAVTVANETYELPEPFLAVATQGPGDAQGTFPLPETLLDRFLLKVEMPSPGEEQVELILDRTTTAELRVVERVLAAERLAEISAVARKIRLPPEARRLAAELLAATRPDHPAAPESVKRYVQRGAGPRGAQAMVLAGKARALFAGRSDVGLDDIRAHAVAALGHRLVLNFEGHADEACPAQIIRDVLEMV
ncbi:MAG: AAA domain-containing protein [Planctomycetales bacterium]|nr:AAA domain-containing protein [Planctomycetales bacterium]